MRALLLGLSEVSKFTFLALSLPTNPIGGCRVNGYGGCSTLWRGWFLVAVLADWFCYAGFALENVENRVEKKVKVMDVRYIVKEGF